MKRCFSALLAAVCLLGLTGCGSKGEIKEGMYYEASGISPDAILVTVNEQEIPAERYLYWLTYNCDYAVRHLGENPDWTQVRTIEPRETTVVEEGSSDEGKTEDKEEPKEQTLDEYVKQMALNNTALYAIVEEWAELHTIELTAEDKSAMAASYQALCDSYGGESTYLAYLAGMGVSPELAESYTRDYYLYKRLYDLFLQADSPLAPAEGALEDFAHAQQLCTVDYIFISTEETGGDPAALAQRRERAQMVVNQLNAKTNPPADFYMILEAYSDRKDFSNGGLTFAPGESGFGETFEAEAARLGEWEYSQSPIEGPDGFYILRGRALDTDAISALYFDQTLADAVAAAKISTARPYKKLTAEAYFTKMTELKNGVGDTASADSSGERGAR